MTDPTVTPDPMDEAATEPDSDMPRAEPTVWLAAAKRIRDEAVDTERANYDGAMADLHALVEEARAAVDTPPRTIERTKAVQRLRWFLGANYPTKPADSAPPAGQDATPDNERRSAADVARTRPTPERPPRPRRRPVDTSVVVAHPEQGRGRPRVHGAGGLMIADLVRSLWLRFTVCRKQGHVWERAFYGDAIRAVNGTHLCSRCKKIGDAPR